MRVSETSVAWEFGPRLPADGTRWDLESALLQTLAGASGAPTGGRCDTTTPNSSTGLSPGDWWRSVAEVRRTRCVAGTSNGEAPAAALRRAASSPPPPAPAGDGQELPAAGLPSDRPAAAADDARFAYAATSTRRRGRRLRRRHERPRARRGVHVEQLGDADEQADAPRPAMSAPAQHVARDPIHSDGDEHREREPHAVDRADDPRARPLGGGERRRAATGWRRAAVARSISSATVAWKPSRLCQ